MKKELVKQHSFEMKENAHELTSFPNALPQVISRELNIYARLLFIAFYSFLCFLTGFFFFSHFYAPEKMAQTSNSEKMEKYLEQQIAETERTRLELLESGRFQREQLELYMSEVMHKDQNISREIIRRQADEIGQLKKQIHGLLSLSNSNIELKPRFELFSEDRLNVLRFEHDLKIGNFKRNQDLQLQAFSSTLNPADPLELARLQDFKDKQRIELFTLQEELRMERKKFKEEGQRSIASTNTPGPR